MKAVQTDPSVFKEVNFFIQQLDNFEVEVKPNLKSQKQTIIADKLHVAIEAYRLTTDQYKVAEKGQQFVNTHEPAHPRTDYERKGVSEALQMLTPEQLDKLWEERHHAAVQLRLCITQARTHGMVRPGPALLKQLKQCRENNEELNKRLVILGAQYEGMKKDLEGLRKLMPNPLKNGDRTRDE